MPSTRKVFCKFKTWSPFGNAFNSPFSAVTTDGSGTVAINADGLSVDYTPSANFNGTETITYTVSDGALTSTGTFTITVTAVNDMPVAVDDGAVVPFVLLVHPVKSFVALPV